VGSGLGHQGPACPNGFRHGRVGVPPDDQVDARNGHGHLPVLIESEVRQDDDHVGPQRSYLPHDLGKGGYGIEEYQPLHVVALRRIRRVGGADADDGDPGPFPLQQDVRGDPGKRPSRVVDDRSRQERKRRPGAQLSQDVEPPVELVVPERHRIEGQGVHDLEDRSAVEQVGGRGPLEHVTGGKEDGPGGILPALLPDPTREQGRPACRRVGEPRLRRGRLHPPVEIVHMQDGQGNARNGPGRRGPGAGKGDQRGKKI